MVKTTGKYQQDAETTNEDEEETTESVSSSTSGRNSAERSSSISSGIIITALPPPKPASQATLITVLSNSPSSGTLKNTGIVNTAYNESESNLFTVFTRRMTSEEANTDTSTLKQSSSGAVLQRQSGTAKHSKSFAVSPNPAVRKRMLSRPIVLVPLIVISLVLVCLLITGLVYVIVKAQNDLQNKSAANKGDGVVATTTNSPPGSGVDEAAAAGQQAETVSVRSGLF